MTTFDLTPLFRSTVGFDRLNRLFDAAFSLNEAAPSYPPYNIEKHGEDKYRITMAVAGFAEDEIAVTFQENLLVVAGQKKEQPEEPEEKDAEYLYRGIATRAFERRFQLADHVKATGAELRDGLLKIDLALEVPEAMKPRRIEIRRVEKPAKAIAGKAA